MIIVTCPAVHCRYNGYGECQLGVVANILSSGAVTQETCPYFDPAEEVSEEAPEEEITGLSAAPDPAV